MQFDFTPNEAFIILRAVENIVEVALHNSDNPGITREGLQEEMSVCWKIREELEKE